MKKILSIIIITLSVLLIYLGFKDDKVYYLYLGDYISNGINPYGTKDYGYTDYVEDYLEENNLLEVSVNGLVDNDKRIIDIIKEIKENSEILVNGKIKTFQNVLIKADLVTMSIGSNDLFQNVQFNNDFSENDLYNKFEQVMVDYEDLFKLLREYCKEEIILIGLYNVTNNDELDEFFKYANNRIYNLSASYNINYINIYEDFKNPDYFPNFNTIYPNKFGYEVISNKINNVIDEKIIKNT